MDSLFIVDLIVCRGCLIVVLLYCTGFAIISLRKGQLVALL